MKKELKIGILRIHEEFWPFLETLIKGLGHIPVKGTTSRKTMNFGTKECENEQCVAVKIAMGQAMDLIESVDYLLIPNLISIYGRTWTCPKWLGLYDMIKTTVEPRKILHPTADANPDIGVVKAIKRITNPTLASNIGRIKRLGFTPLQVMGLDLGKSLGSGTIRSLRAIIKAQKAQNKSSKEIQNEQISKDPRDKTIALIGHPYLINDEFLNFKLTKKLKNLGEWSRLPFETEKKKIWGINIITPEAVPQKVWEKYAKMYRKHIFWGTHRRMIGSLLYWLDEGKLDGVIFLTGAFCGEDALMEPIYNNIMGEAGIVFTRITMDEHSAEAGLITRIEAFADTLPKKRSLYTKKSVNEIIPTEISAPLSPVISCPNLGYASIAIKALCEKMGVPFVESTPTTWRSTNRALRNTPEFACRPFKVTLGNMIETLEKHPEVNVFLQGGGSGPCKYGLYHESQQVILENMREEIVIWPIKPPSEEGISSFFKCFSLLDQYKRKTIGRSEIEEVIKRYLKREETPNIYKDLPQETLWQVIKYGYLIMRGLDQIYKEGIALRLFEEKKGSASQYIKRAQSLFLNIGPNISEIPEITEEAFRILREMPAVIDLKNPIEIKKAINRSLKIGIVGEFYEVLASESNFDIARWLGERGVYVERGIHGSDWIDPSRKCVVEGTPRKEIANMAKSYLGFCGGDGQETIGHIIHYFKNGFDGVIAIRPLGCMPETVAAQVIPYLPEYGINIPVLIVTFDDQEAGSHLLTRLEAFLDQITSQKQMKEVMFT